jgi:hypothetical protein
MLVTKERASTVSGFPQSLAIYKGLYPTDYAGSSASPAGPLTPSSSTPLTRTV